MAKENDHIWYPFTPMRLWAEEAAPTIVAGEGSYLIDNEGRKYLDGVSSLWTTVHGHCHPELNRAISEQLKKIAHTTMLGLSNEPALQLAERLVGIAPKSLNRVFYSDNGSTAVEIALKIAYQYRQLSDDAAEKKRRRFISFHNAYHGDTLGSVSAGGIDIFHATFRDLVFPVEFSEYPYYYRNGRGRSRKQYLDDCLSRFQQLVDRVGDQVCAAIIEPLVQGAGGIITAEKGFLAGVREITRNAGIHLIADEVATGFGRTGRMFACEHEGVEPDFLCVAKGITGGYLPLAATLTSEEVFQRFLGKSDSPSTFYHGHTYTGNPLAASAALANLDIFEKDSVLEEMQDKIKFLAATLQQEIAVIECVGDVRQRGFMVGIELVRDRETGMPFDPSLRMGHRVVLEARKRGVIVRPLGNVVVLMPHLSFSADQLETLVRVTAESISSAVDNLSEEEDGV